MSTTSKCDICKKVIKDDKGLHMWDHRVPARDICLTCWLDPQKWSIIHKIKKSTY